MLNENDAYRTQKCELIFFLKKSRGLLSAISPFSYFFSDKYLLATPCAAIIIAKLSQYLLGAAVLCEIILNSLTMFTYAAYREVIS